MQKVLSVFSCLCLLFSLAACSGTQTNGTTSTYVPTQTEISSTEPVECAPYVGMTVTEAQRVRWVGPSGAKKYLGVNTYLMTYENKRYKVWVDGDNIVTQVSSWDLVSETQSSSGTATTRKQYDNAEEYYEENWGKYDSFEDAEHDFYRYYH